MRVSVYLVVCKQLHAQHIHALCSVVILSFKFVIIVIDLNNALIKTNTLLFVSTYIYCMFSLLYEI